MPGAHWVEVRSFWQLWSLEPTTRAGQPVENFVTGVFNRRSAEISANIVRSGSRQESTDGRAPLSLRVINLGDFTRPCSREVDRRPDKKREVFLRTCGPNLLVEFECFSGQVSAHFEPDPPRGN